MSERPPKPDDVTKVLFVCVHNAARSRIAEAFLKARGGERFDVRSAGFEPHEANPIVVEVMAQIGLPLTTLEPQPSVFELFRAGTHFHYVISVCDEEQNQKCPIFPGVNKRLSWSFPDPAAFTGTPQQKLARVVEVRDAIAKQIDAWLESLGIGDRSS